VIPPRRGRPCPRVLQTAVGSTALVYREARKPPGFPDIQPSCPQGHSVLSRASGRHARRTLHRPRGVERRVRTADDHPHADHGPPAAALRPPASASRPTHRLKGKFWLRGSQPQVLAALECRWLRKARSGGWAWTNSTLRIRGDRHAGRRSGRAIRRPPGR
jgi:hypothetical protein